MQLNNLFSLSTLLIDTLQTILIVLYQTEAILSSSANNVSTLVLSVQK